jgi:pantoate--beta-alanine ligase
MQIVTTVNALRETISAWRSAGLSIAFVPTMGNLHAGHLKLVQIAQTKADKVVVSIFVNPTQFAEGEDFATYPRTEHEDQQKLSDATTDLVFLPSVTEMYSSDAKTLVTVSGLSEVYCGVWRPGHFTGVATVVCKLFNMVKPDIAFFGLKDYQQFTIIKTMVKDLAIDIALQGVETVREASGLALSSRNGYLSAHELTLAPMLYQSLCQAKEAILSKQSTMQEIEQKAINYLQATGFQPDYFSICRADDLRLATMEDKDLVLLVAAKLGSTRLIDNLVFSKP